MFFVADFPKCRARTGIEIVSNLTGVFGRVLRPVLNTYCYTYPGTAVDIPVPGVHLRGVSFSEVSGTVFDCVPNYTGVIGRVY